ncbi:MULTISPECIES: hypothetical protein [unclassified Paraburkholderia]|uniref:hypothetical protein n=1 Tax=unclassified Paraburkholderia TaxID=2615204 RepID=UPI00161D0D2A|nr:MULTISPECIES: hypothetical protein [unclassified Paraburkholderia]MBB5446517.1 hypothetical protein [Paraburkholderia sp. WSM4177]MBB5487063.1 hypothetical protein [Paraburkholderia sp. WSM4180]
MVTDPDDTDLRHSATDSRSTGFDLDGPDESGVPPPRFGRLALCLAAAGALTFGVMGTVAYGVWFNQDQQTYADAIAGARQALGSSASAGVPTVAVAHAPEEAAAPFAVPSARQPAAPDVALAAAGAHGGFEDTNPAAWSGQIRPSTPDPNLTATLADTPVDTSADMSANPPTAPIVPTPPPGYTRHVANAANSTAKPAAGHDAKETRLAQQERRASSQHKGGLFARIGQFFRRVSYRQHDNGRRQQDTYSHP